jgi:hypothetical protein
MRDLRAMLRSYRETARLRKVNDREIAELKKASEEEADRRIPT